MSVEESENQNDQAQLELARFGSRRVKEYESVEEALRSAYWGEEVGAISTISVRDQDGDVVFDRDMGNIFQFCEDRNFDWVADY